MLVPYRAIVVINEKVMMNIIPGHTSINDDTYSLYHDNLLSFTSCFSGGAWYYTEHIRPNQGAGSYDKLVTNTSKEMSCFSDLPMPDHFPQVSILQDNGQ